MIVQAKLNDRGGYGVCQKFYWAKHYLSWLIIFKSEQKFARRNLVWNSACSPEREIKSATHMFSEPKSKGLECEFGNRSFSKLVEDLENCVSFVVVYLRKFRSMMLLLVLTRGVEYIYALIQDLSMTRE